MKLAFEQRDDSGVLFKNNRKNNERAPDYTGNGMVNGEEVRISGWIKQGKNGKFLSLAFKLKSESNHYDQRRSDDDSEDVPF